MDKLDVLNMAMEADLGTNVFLRLVHFANLVVAHEHDAILQTIDELDDDRHPMFAEGYRHALRHIREFTEGRGKG